MSRIDDLIAEYCPDGVKHQTLGEIGELFEVMAFRRGIFKILDSGASIMDRFIPIMAYLPIIRSRSLTQTWLKNERKHIKAIWL